jgi:hypothetical protein
MENGTDISTSTDPIGDTCTPDGKPEMNPLSIDP